MTSRVKQPLFACAALAWLAVACSGEAITCGAGTVDKGGQCVVATDALSCGAGTALVNGACVATQDAAGGTSETAAVEVGDDAASETAPSEDAAGADTTADLACAPKCVGRECGDDGCGGSCGACKSSAAPACDPVLGKCVAACVPNCLGKDCGSNGCGGSCGACAADLKCADVGRCVPPAWTCAAQDYNGGNDPCDCGCGAPDPDCKNADNLLAGCNATQKCDATGKCVSKVPSGWTCAATAYGGLDNCDCGCGVVDPDCAWGMPLVGCKNGETCNASGVCAACKPSCTGKSCGDDGCGGTCGNCTDPNKSACVAGACVDPCKPTPVACQTAQCGPDGCGGSCGTCPGGTACQGGACLGVALPVAATSCQGACGTTAPSGCYCVAGCQDDKSCCADFAAVCSCKADCVGKQCGGDGCGGSCGLCGGSAPYCGTDGKCTASCTKTCDGKDCGDDGCGGQCGQCKDGGQCSYNAKCVPATWFCPLGYFGDGVTCDCGCGAVDPDCSKPKLPTFGCPAKSGSCGATGICGGTFCNSDSACSSPSWCTGVWFSGNGQFKGVCSTPDALAKANGLPCNAGAECASKACIAGVCAKYCATDGQCLSGQRCLAAMIPSTATYQPIGLAAVCRDVAGSAQGCDKQSACPKGELCQAFGDGPTLKARYLCTTGSASVSGSCFVGAACGDGKQCAPWGDGGVCTIGCPAGQTDCPAGSECISAPLSGKPIAGLGDEPKVARCIPK